MISENILLEKPENCEQDADRRVCTLQQNPNYHAEFKSVGVAHELEQANQALSFNKIIRPSEKLMRISLANPTDAELAAYVTRFREVGVDLPYLYPYFEPGEDKAFKIDKVEEIVRSERRRRGSPDAYFSFLGSHSIESAFIFSALSAVFNPTRTLVKV